MAQLSTTQPVTGGVAYGVTSLVTGILALLTGWIFWLSIPLGVVAIVFGVLGMKRPASRGMAIAGLVTGIVGAVFGLAVLLFWVLAIVGASHAPPTYPIYYY